MSLKIRISKQQTVTQIHKPTKKRLQRGDSEEDLGDVHADEPRPKKSRTASRPASEYDYAEDEPEADIDIESEDTRFLPNPPSRSASPRPTLKRASSSKSKPKEPKAPKAIKAPPPSGKRARRQVVWTDDEDSEGNVDAGAILDESDEEFDPDPDPVSSRRAAKAKLGKILVGGGKGTKGKSGKKEEKEIIIRDERKVVVPPRRPSPVQEPHLSARDDRHNPGGSPDTPAPPPPKRKLPPIKKNKPLAGSSTLPTTAKPPAPSKEVSVTPTTNNAHRQAASKEINLLDSSVWTELFSQSKPGGATPDSGLNRKQKEEERRKELNKMRDEARAARELETKHAFNLQAVPDKIQRFEEVLRGRRSMARYPNILGAAFKEMQDRARVNTRER